jgi:hypothetical protein
MIYALNMLTLGGIAGFIAALINLVRLCRIEERKIRALEGARTPWPLS